MASYATMRGPTVVKTGATHQKQDEYEHTIDGIDYILYVPKRNATAEAKKELNKAVIDIATNKYNASNEKGYEVWIKAIQQVFDNT